MANWTKGMTALSTAYRLALAGLITAFAINDAGAQGLEAVLRNIYNSQSVGPSAPVTAPNAPSSSQNTPTPPPAAGSGAPSAEELRRSQVFLGQRMGMAIGRGLWDEKNGFGALTYELSPAARANPEVERIERLAWDQVLIAMDAQMLAQRGLPPRGTGGGVVGAPPPSSTQAPGGSAPQGSLPRGPVVITRQPGLPSPTSPQPTQPASPQGQMAIIGGGSTQTVTPGNMPAARAPQIGSQPQKPGSQTTQSGTGTTAPVSPQQGRQRTMPVLGAGSGGQPGTQSGTPSTRTGQVAPAAQATPGTVSGQVAPSAQQTPGTAQQANRRMPIIGGAPQPGSQSNQSATRQTPSASPSPQRNTGQSASQQGSAPRTNVQGSNPSSTVGAAGQSAQRSAQGSSQNAARPPAVAGQPGLQPAPSGTAAQGKHSPGQTTSSASLSKLANSRRGPGGNATVSPGVVVVGQAPKAPAGSNIRLNLPSGTRVQAGTGTGNAAVLANPSSPSGNQSANSTNRLRAQTINQAVRLSPPQSASRSNAQQGQQGQQSQLPSLNQPPTGAIGSGQGNQPGIQTRPVNPGTAGTSPATQGSAQTAGRSQPVPGSQNLGPSLNQPPTGAIGSGQGNQPGIQTRPVNPGTARRSPATQGGSQTAGRSPSLPSNQNLGPSLNQPPTGAIGSGQGNQPGIQTRPVSPGTSGTPRTSARSAPPVRASASGLSRALLGTVASLGFRPPSASSGPGQTAQSTPSVSSPPTGASSPSGNTQGQTTTGQAPNPGNAGQAVTPGGGAQGSGQQTPASSNGLVTAGQQGAASPQNGSSGLKQLPLGASGTTLASASALAGGQPGGVGGQPGGVGGQAGGAGGQAGGSGGQAGGAGGQAGGQVQAAAGAGGQAGGASGQAGGAGGQVGGAGGQAGGAGGQAGGAGGQAGGQVQAAGGAGGQAGGAGGQAGGAGSQAGGAGGQAGGAGGQAGGAGGQSSGQVQAAGGAGGKAGGAGGQAGGAGGQVGGAGGQAGGAGGQAAGAGGQAGGAGGQVGGAGGQAGGASGGSGSVSLAALSRATRGPASTSGAAASFGAGAGAPGSSGAPAGAAASPPAGSAPAGGGMSAPAPAPEAPASPPPAPDGPENEELALMREGDNTEGLDEELDELDTLFNDGSEESGGETEQSTEEELMEELDGLETDLEGEHAGEGSEDEDAGETPGEENFEEEGGGETEPFPGEGDEGNLADAEGEEFGDERGGEELASGGEGETEGAPIDGQEGETGGGEELASSGEGDTEGAPIDGLDGETGSEEASTEEAGGGETEQAAAEPEIQAGEDEKPAAEEPKTEAPTEPKKEMTQEEIAALVQKDSNPGAEPTDLSTLSPAEKKAYAEETLRRIERIESTQAQLAADNERIANDKTADNLDFAATLTGGIVALDSVSAAVSGGMEMLGIKSGKALGGAREVGKEIGNLVNDAASTVGIELDEVFFGKVDNGLAPSTGSGGAGGSGSEGGAGGSGSGGAQGGGAGGTGTTPGGPGMADHLKSGSKGARAIPSIYEKVADSSIALDKYNGGSYDGREGLRDVKSAAEGARRTAELITKPIESAEAGVKFIDQVKRENDPNYWTNTAKTGTAFVSKSTDSVTSSVETYTKAERFIRGETTETRLQDRAMSRKLKNVRSGTNMLHNTTKVLDGNAPASERAKAGGEIIVDGVSILDNTVKKSPGVKKITKAFGGDGAKRTVEGVSQGVLAYEIYTGGKAQAENYRVMQGGATKQNNRWIKRLDPRKEQLKRRYEEIQRSLQGDN